MAKVTVTWSMELLGLSRPSIRMVVDILIGLNNLNKHRYTTRKIGALVCDRLGLEKKDSAGVRGVGRTKPHYACADDIRELTVSQILKFCGRSE